MSEITEKIKNLILKNKTVKGMGWSALENVTRMGVTFVVSVILARLLSPEEYGLIGILTIFIAIFNKIDIILQPVICYWRIIFKFLTKSL